MTISITPDNPAGTETPEPKKPARKEKSSITANLLKGVSVLVLTLALLLAGVGIVLQYYFPSEAVTPIAERELSRLLNLPVNIGKIEFSLLKGARVRDIRLGDDFLSVREVTLDYDLTQLIQGNLVINEIGIDVPELKAVSTEGRWNFQPLLKTRSQKTSGPKSPPPPTVQPAPVPLPQIPVTVDIRKLSVNRIRLTLNRDDKVIAFAEGLNLEARGKVQANSIDLQLQIRLSPPLENATQPNLSFTSNAGPSRIEVNSRTAADLTFSSTDLNQILLSGSFSLNDNAVFAGKDLPAPNLSGKVSITGQIKPQTLTLENLSLQIADKEHMEIAGKVTDFLTNPDFQMHLKEASFDVEELLRLASGLIPSIKAQGEIAVTDFHIAGRLPEFKPETLEVLGGTATFKNLSADYPPLNAHIDGLHGSASVNKIHLRNLIPDAVNLETRIETGAIRFREFSLKRMNHIITFSGQGANLPRANLGFSVSIPELAYTHPEMGRLQTSLRSKGSLHGDLLSGNIPAFQLSYGIGPLIEGELSGDLADFGRKSIHSTQTTKIKLGEIEPLLPVQLKDKIKNAQLGGEILLHTNMEGRLNQNFSPATLKLRNRLDAQSLHLKIAKPQIEISGLSAGVSFPAKFDPERGVIIPELEINTRFKSIKALDQFEVGPAESKTRMTMKDFFNINAPGIVPITQRTSFKTQNFTSRAPQIHASGLSINTEMTGDWHPGDFRNAALNGTVSLKSIAGLNKIKVENVLTRFNISVPDLSLANVRTSVKTTVGSSTLKEGDLEFNLDPVTLEVSLKLNQALGDLRLERLFVDSPSLFHLEAKGGVGNRGKTFSLDEMAGRLRLAALWKKLPESLRAKMPDLLPAGTARVTLSGNGALPEPADLKNLILPFTVAAKFALEDTSLNLPEQGLRIENLSSSAQLSLEQDKVEVSGTVASGKIFTKAGSMPLEPEFSFLYHLENFDKLTFDRHEASLKNLGLTHKLSGNVEGLKSFITGKTPASLAEILNRINASVTTENRLHSNKAAIPLPPGSGAEGALTSRLSANLEGGKSVAVEGAMEFDRFQFHKTPLVRAGPIDGTLIFSKKLVLDKHLLDTQKKTNPVAQRGFFQQVREFSPYQNILRIEEIEIARQKVSRIGIGLFFKDNRLMVENFLLDVLGGSVGGNLFLAQDADGPALKLSAGFTNLDFAKLGAPLAEGKGNSAEVDGNVELDFKIRSEKLSNKVSLDQLKIRSAVTRIGAETLDRVLLFLDPEESKPAIADMRGKLKLASPHHLIVTLENGNLGVEVWLQDKVLGTLIKAPELKRVPISSLKQFRQISEAFQALTKFEDVLSYLSANGLSFDDEKGMTLF